MGAFVRRQFGFEALNANAETQKSLKVPLRWVSHTGSRSSCRGTVQCLNLFATRIVILIFKQIENMACLNATKFSFLHFHAASKGQAFSHHTDMDQSSMVKRLTADLVSNKPSALSR